MRATITAGIVALLIASPLAVAKGGNPLESRVSELERRVTCLEYRIQAKKPPLYCLQIRTPGVR